MSTLTSKIDQPYTVSADDIAAYREQGFVHLRGVLDAEEMGHWRRVIGRGVFGSEKYQSYAPIEDRDTYGKAFLQIGNIWARDAEVARFACCKRLASIAAQLMELPSVRMYHDQALYKEAHGGLTPWHCDQHYWPLSNDRSITAWVPLVDVPVEMGPLSFAAGSHRHDFGRELAISDESEARIQRQIREAGLDLVELPYALGDVSFHAGWCFHRAGGNSSDRCREVMTMIYIDSEMRYQPSDDPRVGGDRDNFCPGRKPGERFDTALNPVLWP